CIKYNNNNTFNKLHDINCFKLHHQHINPRQTKDPLSLILNKLPNQNLHLLQESNTYNKY
ncbi:hypothetical protein BDC45DRAFT_428664, partial [Circinella umbellata]